MAPACAAALSLPRLSGAIPHALYPVAHARDGARLALFLLDAGAITDVDLREPGQGEVELMARALNRWLARHLSGLRLIAPRFLLCPDTQGDDAFGTPRSAVQAEHVRVIWHCDRIVQACVGERLEYLEQAVPGLGRTALRALWCSGQTFRTFTPDDTLEVASYLYWGYEEDERGYLAEIEDEEEREAARANMVTRAKIEQAMPAWVFARGRPLSVARLRAVRSSAPGAFTGAVCEAILRLRRIQVPAFPFEIDGEFVDFAAVASWREDDIVVRVLDDLLQLAGETECCDISGYVRFDPAEPHAFGQWMKRMTPFLKATAALDHLLWLLAAADYGQGGR